MVTHSSILAWRIPWTEEPGGVQFMASQESDTTQGLNYQDLPVRNEDEDQIHISYYKSTLQAETEESWPARPVGTKGRSSSGSFTQAKQLVGKQAGRIRLDRAMYLVSQWGTHWAESKSRKSRERKKEDREKDGQEQKRRLGQQNIPSASMGRPAAEAETPHLPQALVPGKGSEFLVKYTW